MIIDLSEIIRNDSIKINLDTDISLEPIEFLGESFQFAKPLHVIGTIINNTKSLELAAKVKGEMGACCARCREPLTVAVEFNISEVIMQNADDIAEEDVIIIEGEEIDIAEIILNNFLMNVSGKYLCKDDCKGLCLKCGKNLNEGDCGCSDDEIDPRWAKLAEIMKDSSDTK